MATNAKHIEGRRLSLTASHPTSPDSGQPLRVGQMTGVAVIDEASDGTTSVDFGGVYDLSVKGVDDSGNSAVAVGDQLFYVDADINDGTGFLSKKTSGYFFGFALEAVSSGATTTVKVLNVSSPGPGTADILAGAIGTSELAADAVTGAKIADDAVDSEHIAAGALDTEHYAADSVTGAKIDSGFLDVYSVDGQDETMDATYDVTGVASGDAVIAVLHLSTKADVATIDVLSPALYTVTGANVITAGTPADRSSDQLIFFVLDQT